MMLGVEGTVIQLSRRKAYSNPSTIHPRPNRVTGSGNVNFLGHGVSNNITDIEIVIEIAIITAIVIGFLSWEV